MLLRTSRSLSSLTAIPRPNSAGSGNSHRLEEPAVPDEVPAQLHEAHADPVDQAGTAAPARAPIVQSATTLDDLAGEAELPPTSSAAVDHGHLEAEVLAIGQAEPTRQDFGDQPGSAQTLEEGEGVAAAAAGEAAGNPVRGGESVLYVGQRSSVHRDPANARLGGPPPFPKFVPMSESGSHGPSIAQAMVLGAWLFSGGVSALVGQPGVGKSLYTTAMAVCAATGMSLAGEAPPRAVATLLVNAEDTVGETWRRAKAFALSIGADLALLEQNLLVMDMTVSFRLALKTPSREIEDTREAMRFWAKVQRFGIKLIVFDPYIEFTAGNETDNDDQHRVMALIRKRARDLGCAVVIVHHTGKLEGRPTLSAIRGASAIGGVVRSARVVTELTKKEVEVLRLSAGEDRNWFAVDDLKNSYGPRIARPFYYQRLSTVVDGIVTPYIVYRDPEAGDDIDG